MISLSIPNDVVQALYRQAREEWPNECCGFLAGEERQQIGCIAESIPIVNETPSPVAYRTEPASLFAAYRTLRDRQLELLAVYHSHPNQPAVPSRRDREEWTYGETVCAIVGMAGGLPELRMWRLDPHQAMEVELIITDHPLLPPR